MSKNGVDDDEIQPMNDQHYDCSSDDDGHDRCPDDKLTKDDDGGEKHHDLGHGSKPKTTHARNDSLSNLMSLQSRAAEQADKLVKKVLEEAENAELYVRKVINEAWNVCHFHHLPQWLQDNDYLHKGHRPELHSFKACFWSIFRLHTETGNIWTHMIGCLVFAILAANVLMFAPMMKYDDKIVFGIFFAGAIICLGLSSTYHTFSCHSQNVGKFFSKLDYCGIALLITGSFVPWLYYGFYCEYLPKFFYLILVTTLGTCCVIVSLMDKFGEPNYRPVRAITFASFGLSGVIPGFHWLLSQEWLMAVSLRDSFICLVSMGLLYLLGAFLYAMRIPERFFPGKCDYWFHSHQIFHILVIAAAIVHYRGVREMAMYRIANDSVCDAGLKTRMQSLFYGTDGTSKPMQYVQEIFLSSVRPEMN